jgi:DNA-binding transcriptional ArsR family regulator
LVIKERESKQRAYALEAQVAEVRDELRGHIQELEGRSRENEHLISLLED